MRAKLSELSPTTQEKIVQLEASAMLPILASVGISITVDDIRKAIQADQSQTVLICEDHGQLSALVRYKIEADRIFISSIQFARPEKGLKSLRGILGIALMALEEETKERIESVVQKTNHASIAFHEKLGFRRVKDNPKAIRFEVERLELIASLKRVLRR